MNLRYNKPNFGGQKFNEMKFYSISLFGLLLVAGSFFYTEKAAEEVTLSCKLNDCGNVLKLYQFDGVTFREIQSVNAGAEGLYEFKVPKGDPSFYYVGQNPRSIIPIILGPEDKLELKGNCAQIRESEIVASPFQCGVPRDTG